ncbi:FAD-binding domain-containing protein [Roseicyclus sp.]|uniref:FAD-binding domain-containing protein n=1 Tax=Roseicyclus sp. TaxID=1914329 RepID=UPI003F9F372F
MIGPLEPTRAAGLERLARFLPKAGRAYAAGRNHDRPDEGHPAVSGLSPWLRHRLLTEAEVLEAVLGRHGPAAAEKFVQEVFWRTYWKGWLERRPAVWAEYLRGRDAALGGDLAPRIAEAEAGRTGIECFDAWARELTASGYLHNHARMWTASIWIFTLRLPWEAGADWFLRHLADGDPASNTLGWRWVAGIQTPGKHYVARAENIARYTGGRFNPAGLLDEAPEPVPGPAPPKPGPVPEGGTPAPGLATGVLLTEEDLSPAFLLRAIRGEVAAHATLLATAGRSPRPVADIAAAFARGAVEDARARWAGRLGARGPDATEPAAVADWAAGAGLAQVVTAWAPVGPTAEALDRLERLLAARGIALVRVLRPEDRAAWAHATHGFFRFRERIPELIEDDRASVP